jgi:hypothetical protein
MRIIATCILLFVFYYLFTRSGLRFLSQFPNSFTWTELLINYQGGFIKRGLLGEIAFNLHHIIHAQIFFTGVVVSLYIIVATWMVIQSSKRLDFGTFLLLFSPAGLLFPIYDLQAFGRKDIFIIAAFLLSAGVVWKIKPKPLALALIMLVYLATGLVIETAWFYFPLAATFVIARHSPSIRWQIGMALFCILYLVLCYPLASAYPLVPPENQIILSWRSIGLTNAFEERLGALLYVGFSIHDATNYSLFNTELWTEQPRNSYFFGFILASIPLIVLLRKWRSPFTGMLTFAGISAAVLVMMVPFFVAADWGRYIYLFTFQAGLYIIITDTSPTKSIDLMTKSWPMMFVKLPFFILFAGSWTLAHWVNKGNIGLLPGYILRAIGF